MKNLYPKVDTSRMIVGNLWTDKENVKTQVGKRIAVARDSAKPSAEAAALCQSEALVAMAACIQAMRPQLKELECMIRDACYPGLDDVLRLSKQLAKAAKQLPEDLYIQVNESVGELHRLALNEEALPYLLELQSLCKFIEAEM